ncbi:hypothetical protein [Nocardia sp. NBC_01329]|uniref:hypothetical protein n=1 Tax=Nocardia sp. NBC_01329 TaxID=2903594 RepID=UPI002E0F02F1|nr:hypothetical protein OG405_28420 [Nocardia sp. NBC_01329]
MRFSRSIFIAALAAGSIVSGASTAHADPNRPEPVVSYHAALVGRSVVTTLDHGTFADTHTGGSVDIRNAAGELLDTLPVTYSLDGRALDLRRQISDDGRTLTITPDITGLDRAALRPVASPVENQLAMNDLINAVSISTSLGTLVGTALGAIAGIGIGIAVSGVACAALSLGCVVAVLPIMSLAAAAGGITGLIVAGGPISTAAAFDYITTLNAPPGTSKYAEQVQGEPGSTPLSGTPR